MRLEAWHAWGVAAQDVETGNQLQALAVEDFVA